MHNVKEEYGGTMTCNSYFMYNGDFDTQNNKR